MDDNELKEQFMIIIEFSIAKHSRPVNTFQFAAALDNINSKI